MTEPSAALILASKIEARAWTGTEEFAFNHAEGHMIIAALRAAPASEPVWGKISEASPSMQAFAKVIAIDDSRTGYIEYCGTIEDGRPFVLCRASPDPANTTFDRFFILPRIDSVPRAAAPTSAPTAWGEILESFKGSYLSVAETIEALEQALQSSPAPDESNSASDGQKDSVPGAGGAISPADHKTIWLSPACGEERTWSVDAQGCDECDMKPTKYVRADLAASPSDLAEVLANVRAGIEKIKTEGTYLPHDLHLACQALTRMTKGTK